MRKLRQLSVGQKVGLIFGALCLVLLGIGALIFFTLRSIANSNQEQQLRTMGELGLIEDAAQQMGEMQADVLQEILASDPGEIRSLDQTTRDLEKTNAEQLANYTQFINSEEEKELYDRVMSTRKAYWVQTQAVLAFGLANQDDDAKKFINSTQAPAYDEYRNAIDALDAHVETEANEAAKATTHYISSIRIIGDTLAGVAIAIAIGTGFAVAGITRGLKKDNALLQKEVAERKRAEESLRLLNSAVEQSKEAIVITDSNLALPGPKIIFVNSAFTKMTGYTAKEIFGKTPRILQGPRTDKAVLKRLRQNLERGEVFEGEAVNYRKDGTEFNLEWQIAPLRDGAGNITNYVAIQRDITERKRLESRLFQSQKLETVGKLAGGVAHEFNSILTAIIGQSELLLSDLSPDDTLGKSALEIRRAAERAATLTRQLLAYGRKQILQPETLDLNRVLADMLSTLQHLMGNEVDIRLVPASKLRKVRMDPGQIEQVIVSMAMNAADAMPHGGKLTLETGNITLDEDYVRPFPGLAAGEYVMLAISDTGVGMTDEVKARVFEPFFTTKAVGQGTGLGLATCYGIIKQSEGHISVYSEASRGTTFRVYLPKVVQLTTATLPRLKSGDMPMGKETILLAEDDPSLLEMASALLRRLGYTVHTAVNGIEAMHLRQQRDTGHIDLLLTDVVMPHMNGKELSDRIHASFPHIKILFTSAFAESAIVHQGVLAEGVSLLQKPFTPAALANKVREVLDQP